MSEINICGLVVAGGQSKRMGDENKLLLKLGGETLINRAVRSLSRQVDHVVVNVNNDVRLDAEFDIVGDLTGEGIEEGAGPLLGVLSGLEYIRQKYPDITHIASVPADAPFLPSDLIEKLANPGNGSQIVVPFIKGYTQQLCALWPVSCAGDLRDFLSSGENKKVMNFIGSQEWQKLDLPDEYEEQFINVNTPADWQKAQAIFAEGRYE